MREVLKRDTNKGAPFLRRRKCGTEMKLVVEGVKTTQWDSWYTAQIAGIPARAQVNEIEQSSRLLPGRSRGLRKRVSLWTALLPLFLWSVAFAQQIPDKTQMASKALMASANKNGSEEAGNKAAVDPTYVIGPQDVLDISVWKEPEVSRVLPVRPDGKISLPLLRDVQAAGLTPSQLEARITEGLTGFITAPDVTVIVTAINSRRIYIVGEMTRPGAYPLLPGMTVLQALSNAGGFTQFANTKNIYVLREENGKQMKYPFNFKDVVKGKKSEQNINLKSGDTIVIP